MACQGQDQIWFQVHSFLNHVTLQESIVNKLSIKLFNRLPGIHNLANGNSWMLLGSFDIHLFGSIDPGFGTIKVNGQNKLFNEETELLFSADHLYE